MPAMPADAPTLFLAYLQAKAAGDDAAAAAVRRQWEETPATAPPPEGGEPATGGTFPGAG